MNYKYNIGVGKKDITGPCVEVGFMGMSNMAQKGKGIHTRLYSRAYVVEENRENGSLVAIVVVDLAMCTQAVKSEVIRLLKNAKEFKKGESFVFNDENVLITATHTHCGPGGYSHFLMYNASIVGFNSKNFKCIVNGIVESIKIAYKYKQPGTLVITQGTLDACGGNRSLPAYENNPAQEKEFYKNPCHNEMVLLKFIQGEGIVVGCIDWYAVHPTNMGEKKRLVSSDNKGYAEYLFEKKFPGIIAAFANSCCGDISPNMKYGRPDEIHDVERTYEFGKMQYDKALELYSQAGEEISGSISYRHKYVDMSNCVIDENRRTWPAALGYGMINGSTEDSKGMDKDKWTEGTTKDNIKYGPDFSIKVLFGLTGILGVKWPDEEDLPAGYNGPDDKKPVLFHAGLTTFKDYPIAPSILPLQIIKIGGLVLVTHPGEMTTMAGRRMRKSISQVFGEDSRHLLIAPYSNAYSSYTTTKEEYDMQHYEGASTLYGPWTFDAYQKENVSLAKALKDNLVVETGPAPILIPSNKLFKFPVRHVPDTVLPGMEFGQAESDAYPSYLKGEKVEITFLGGFPNNEFESIETFLAVERKNAGKWEVVYRDSDPCTLFYWASRGTASMVRIVWDISPDEVSGTYRICYYGKRYEFPRKYFPVIGISKEFRVE